MIDEVERYPFVYEGTVLEVDANHRIRADVTGVCSQSAWARPRTVAGGPGRGGHAAPQVGDPVLIQFVAGELENPVYEGAPWTEKDGTSAPPADLVAAGADADAVHALEFRRGSFSLRFAVDERDGKRAFKIVAVELPKQQGGAETVLGSLELDIEKRVIDLYSLAGVQVRSDGFVKIQALATHIMRRRVRRTSSPI